MPFHDIFFLPNYSFLAFIVEEGQIKNCGENAGTGVYVYSVLVQISSPNMTSS